MTGTRRKKINQGNGTFRELTDEEMKELGFDVVAPKNRPKIPPPFASTLIAKKRELRIFEEGEEIEIRNSRFKVKSIGKKFITLELLPDLEEPTNV